MTCPVCDGRKWQWVGVPDNAIREECELCEGKGVGTVNWWTVLAWMGIMAGWALVLGLIWYATTSV